MRNLKKKQINEREATEVSEVSINKFGLNLKGNFLKFALLFMLLLFVNVTSTPYGSTLKNSEEDIVENIITPETMYVESVKTKIKLELIGEVNGYITKMAPKSKLSADYLVEKCLEYDTDIVFVLSQGLLESHFGTKGTAVKSNSVWNVGSWDDGQIRSRYKNQNESIEPYLKLINEDYFITITSRGDTINRNLYHLVQDKGYKNYNGQRYATAKGYENAMRKLMIRIDEETAIAFYQDIMKLDNNQFLALFAPKEKLNMKNFYALN